MAGGGRPSTTLRVAARTVVDDRPSPAMTGRESGLSAAGISCTPMWRQGALQGRGGRRVVRPPIGWGHTPGRAEDRQSAGRRHRMQGINYLKATGLPLCLLLNFGNPRMEIKRVVHGL